MSEKLVYTVKEVSKLLGMSLPNVYALCETEDFPAVRVSPRRIVIPKAGLEKWLEEKSKGATR